MVGAVLVAFHVFVSFFNKKRGVVKNFEEIRSFKECGKLIWNKLFEHLGVLDDKLKKGFKYLFIENYIDCHNCKGTGEVLI